MSTRVRGEGEIPVDDKMVKIKIGNYEVAEVEESLPRGQFLHDFMNIDTETNNVKGVKTSLILRFGWIALRAAMPGRFSGGADGGFRDFCRWFDEQPNQKLIVSEITQAYLGGQMMSSGRKLPPTMPAAPLDVPSANEKNADGSASLGMTSSPPEQKPA